MLEMSDHEEKRMNQPTKAASRASDDAVVRGSINPCAPPQAADNSRTMMNAKDAVQTVWIVALGVTFVSLACPFLVLGSLFIHVAAVIVATFETCAHGERWDYWYAVNLVIDGWPFRA